MMKIHENHFLRHYPNTLKGALFLLSVKVNLCRKQIKKHLPVVLWAKGSTAYEVQIGRLCVRWCYLYGGHWKHWWQLSRFSYMVEQKDNKHV